MRINYCFPYDSSTFALGKFRRPAIFDKNLIKNFASKICKSHCKTITMCKLYVRIIMCKFIFSYKLYVRIIMCKSCINLHVSFSSIFITKQLLLFHFRITRNIYQYTKQLLFRPNLNRRNSSKVQRVVKITPVPQPVND